MAATGGTVPVAGGDAGAFVPGETFLLRGSSTGPLHGLSFAIKDLYDVAGRRTGGGNPAWREAQKPASRNALVVDRLLDAGASAVGKTITDELAYSIVGRNFHYGIPRNGAAPGHMPGGSSSGSASAVSNKLCDFALGTDSGGSVRVPASYCGLFGMRPTHGRIPLDGCMALTPSYDTCGWFAATAKTLEDVGRVLLEAGTASDEPRVRIAVATDVWEAADDDVVHALKPALETFAGAASAVADMKLFEDEAEWDDVDRHSKTLQAFEAWETFGWWLRDNMHHLGPEIAERFELASKVTAEAARRAAADRVRFSDRLRGLLERDTALCIPTTPTTAARRDVGPGPLQAVRLRTLKFTCIAGLAGLPQVSIPVRTAAAMPCGLAFVGAPGTDEMLLRLVTSGGRP